MQKEIRIFPIQQYIIDKVRLERTNLGISAEELSLEIGSSKSLIGIIESRFTPTTYTDHMLNIIATVFTKKSNSLLGKAREYTLFDFYPDKPLSDIPQLKRMIKVTGRDGVTSSLNKILDLDDFFNYPRTIREITNRCNSIASETWKSNNITSALDNAVLKGKLIKIELPDGGIVYQRK